MKEIGCRMTHGWNTAEYEVYNNAGLTHIRIMQKVGNAIISSFEKIKGETFEQASKNRVVYLQMRNFPYDQLVWFRFDKEFGMMLYEIKIDYDLKMEIRSYFEEDSEVYPHFKGSI